MCSLVERFYYSNARNIATDEQGIDQEGEFKVEKFGELMIFHSFTPKKSKNPGKLNILILIFFKGNLVLAGVSRVSE